MFDASQIRALFPALQQQVNQRKLVYLDNAATTQKPESVIHAMAEYYRYDNANVHRASHALSARATRQFEASREVIQRLVNAKFPQEIIWTQGTTGAINLVANSYGSLLEAGDEVIISAMEHHANIVPWQLLAERSGIKLQIAPINGHGQIDMSAFSALLNENTRLVSVCHVSNALGTLNPIAEIIALSHQAGAKVLIDGAQGIAHCDVDVQQLDCDFYAFSGHKMYGPTGIGVLYGKQALLDAMPPWQGGGEMIKHVSFNGTSFNRLPFKFEAGTPNISAVIGLAQAAEFLQQTRASREHEAQLVAQLLEGLHAMEQVSIIGPTKGQIGSVSFTVTGEHHSDIATLLDEQGIAVRAGHHCAQPLMAQLGLKGTIRASIAAYNNSADIDNFLIALKHTLALLS
ncbi:cysteine desulfurase [Motilimonas pumila]|uniref:Cysteine desulfurase n=1 Tax=Motilimonas pumila TaxID=2303987 RepID=A0A418YJA9_9GAMM|nr:cysteine desulfurase [Motilimonas pumila]RJG50720.1 cysteine desulfurase [Motilimonas pumila]